MKHSQTSSRDGESGLVEFGRKESKVRMESGHASLSSGRLKSTLTSTFGRVILGSVVLELQSLTLAAGWRWCWIAPVWYQVKPIRWRLRRQRLRPETWKSDCFAIVSGIGG